MSSKQQNIIQSKLDDKSFIDNNSSFLLTNSPDYIDFLNPIYYFAIIIVSVLILNFVLSFLNRK